LCIVDESEKTNTHGNSNTEVIEETVNKKVSEIRESTMREKNIIIHGLNEIDSSEPSVQKQKDTKFVTNLAEFLDNDEICIKSVVRIVTHV
jgi:preprotein translocase subunit SecD